MKGKDEREQVCEVEPQSSSKIIQHWQGQRFQAMTLKVQQKLCNKVSEGAISGIVKGTPSSKEPRTAFYI